MSQLLEMAMLAKKAAAADPEASDAVQHLTRSQAAKMMGAGGAAIGAVTGAIRGVSQGPAGAVKGALGGAVTGGVGSAVAGAVLGKGVEVTDDAHETGTNVSKRYGEYVGKGLGALGVLGGAAAGAVAKGLPGALAGAALGGAAYGGLGYVGGRVGGYMDGRVGHTIVGKTKEASEMITMDDIQLAKTAAEELYNEAIAEANEKIAFAQMLFNEANGAEHAVKVAQDNGPAIGVPYIDQVKTPAGAAALGAGAGVGGVLGYMKNPSAVGAVGGGVLGAGVVAGAGALKSFIDQHRMARAQQHAQQMGNLERAGQ
jgi:hypothetical protein